MRPKTRDPAASSGPSSGPEAQPSSTGPSSGKRTRSGRSAPPLWVYVLATGVASLAALGVLIGLRWMSDDSPEALPGEDVPSEATDLIPENPEGDRVPTESFEMLNGDEAVFADYEGQPLVVNFWGTSCPPCKKEMPEFEEVYQRFRERDNVAFLGLAVNDTKSAAKEFIDSVGVTYDIGRDVGNKVGPGFAAINLPTTALVDERGIIQEVRVGELSGQELSELITEHLLS